MKDPTVECRRCRAINGPGRTQCRSCGASLAPAPMTERSEPVTWLLWLFLGILGVHRLYLGQVRHGLIMAAVNVVLFVVTGGLWLIAALIWWAIEATRISASVREANRELRAGQPATTPPRVTSAPPADDTASRLRGLKALRDEGIISEEEYESRRMQLIQRL